MRYALAMVLTLILGVSAVIQTAFADEHEGAQMQVATVVAQYQPADPGSVAGSTTPWQVPAVEHDLNRN
jgi:hypothetical protein